MKEKSELFTWNTEIFSNIRSDAIHEKLQIACYISIVSICPCIHLTNVRVLGLLCLNSFTYLVEHIRPVNKLKQIFYSDFDFRRHCLFESFRGLHHYIILHKLTQVNKQPGNKEAKNTESTNSSGVETS